MRNQKGNLFTGVLIALVLLGVSLVATLRFASKYYQSQNLVKKNAAALNANSFDLYLISERFRIRDNKVPTWFMEPYPRADQMLDNQKPLVEVFNVLPEGKAPLVPISLALPDKETLTYIADNTQLGSVLKRTQAARLDTPQSAFVATGDLGTLSIEDISLFLADPSTSWPKTSGNNGALASTVNSQLEFLKVIPDAAHPALAKELVVSISTPSKNGNSRTLAKFTLDAPPTPQCKLQLALGASSPLLPNSNANFNLLTSSIVAYAEVGYAGSFNSVTVPQDQSINNLGEPNTLLATSDVLVPLNPLPGFPAKNGSVPWTVTANVIGVDGTTGTCSTTVMVKSVPLCQITASPTQIKLGQKTTATLTCDGNVIQAFINGNSVSFNNATHSASIDLKPEKAGMFQVEGYATNLLGQSEKVTTTVGVDKAICRFLENPKTSEIFSAWWSSYVVRGPAQENLPAFAVDYGWGWWQWGWPNYVNYTYTSCPNNAYCFWEGTYWGWDIYNQVSLAYEPADSADCKPRVLYARAWGCFAPETEILMADGKHAKIEDLNEGDLVWNPMKKKAIAIRKMVVGPEKIPLYSFSLGGKNIRVTQEHPFVTKRGVLPANQIKDNDLLQASDGKFYKAKRVLEKVVQPEQQVWNFELDVDDKDLDGHIVVANGFITGDLVLQRKAKLKNKVKHVP